MGSKDLLERIGTVRRDFGTLLFHFTQNEVAADVLTPAIQPKSAYGVLNSILKESRLKGSSKLIKGGHKCVCFTEAPISEMAALFHLKSVSQQIDPVPRYEPFGIAVKKTWLFGKGGRPVIYQPPVEYEKLPIDLQYRHVSYDPNGGTDFTWEREWRIKTESLDLDPKVTLVIVPDSQLAFELMYEHSDLVPDYDDHPIPTGAYHQPKWLAVSLDFFE